MSDLTIEEFNYPCHAVAVERGSVKWLMYFADYRHAAAARKLMSERRKASDLLQFADYPSWIREHAHCIATHGAVLTSDMIALIMKSDREDNDDDYASPIDPRFVRIRKSTDQESPGTKLISRSLSGEVADLFNADLFGENA